MFCFFDYIATSFQQKYLFAVSVYSLLILMDVLQFKEHSSIQGGNSFHPLSHFAQLSYFALFFAK